MRVFVTGHQRAGTHTFAETLAQEKGVLYLDERIIGLDDWDGLMLLINQGKRIKWGANGKPYTVDIPGAKDGFVLQCPFLAHKTLDLAKLGKVYWCSADHETIARSKAHWNFGPMLWDIMKAFKAEFPNDPIWDTLQYKGREDVHVQFVGYAYLVCKVKRYFYQTLFKDVAERVVLEDQPYYHAETRAAFLQPEGKGRAAMLKEVEGLNESLCAL